MTVKYVSENNVVLGEEKVDDVSIGKIVTYNSQYYKVYAIIRGIAWAHPAT